MSDKHRLTWRNVCGVTGALLIGCGCLLVAAQWVPANSIGLTLPQDPPAVVNTPNPAVGVMESLSIADVIVYYNPYGAGMMLMCIAVSIGMGATMLLIPWISKLGRRSASFPGQLDQGSQKEGDPDPHNATDETSDPGTTS